MLNMTLANLPNDDRVEKFRTLSQLFSSFVSRAGVEITAFYSKDLPLFRKLPIAQQDVAIDQLRQQIDFYLACEESGWELTELKKLVWYAVSRLGARPPGGELMDLIEDGDIVEIHDEHGQIFRSFTYYNYCSYTKEELTSIHWSELYERDQAAVELIELAVKRAMSENVIVTNPVPPHRIAERRSARQYEISYHVKHFVPLSERKQKSPRYFVAIIKAELLNQKASVDLDEMFFENYILANR